MFNIMYIHIIVIFPCNLSYDYIKLFPILRGADYEIVLFLEYVICKLHIKAYQEKYMSILFT